MPNEMCFFFLKKTGFLNLIFIIFLKFYHNKNYRLYLKMSLAVLLQIKSFVSRAEQFTLFDLPDPLLVKLWRFVLWRSFSGVTWRTECLHQVHSSWLGRNADSSCFCQTLSLAGLDISTPELNYLLISITIVLPILSDWLLSLKCMRIRPPLLSVQGEESSQLAPAVMFIIRDMANMIIFLALRLPQCPSVQVNHWIQP